ncbi:SUMF1/EgtB/PvdO family nonheme iron enzyme (plasmid) [Pseudomonas luteola]|uniref:formylglycine-generating enzyme family protein n=1 Tax=Pseudomonas luteola TaxID=47886 RepID=UPI00388DBB33
MTKFSKISSLLAFSLLAACHSESASLPISKSLSTEKVEQIAKAVDSKYPNLTAPEKADILAIVVRSVDEMVFIEGGKFQMGDFGWACDYNPEDNCTWPCGQPEEQLCNISLKMDAPLHRIELSSYMLAGKKTTLHDFDLFRSALGLDEFQAEERKDPYLKDNFAPNNPAPTKSWREAKEYCGWLGELTGLPFDLPTEAQWEFAARNRGQNVLYPTSNGSLNFGKNYPPKHESGAYKIYPVGSFSPNPLGLYEMGAIATEWVDDWYAEDYYAHSPVKDPKGPSSGSLKISRGSNSAETPWSSANTVMRREMKPEQEHYYDIYSFRCSVQQGSCLRSQASTKHTVTKLKCLYQLL